jgi:hypothetical protein
MSFEPAAPISVVTCDHCQGKGCDYCASQGVHGLKDDQPVVFNLPDFVDFKNRKQLKQLFWIKKISLVVVTVFLISLSLYLLL